MAEDNVRGETIEKDLQIDSLSMNMIWNRLLWDWLNHETDSNQWENTWLLLLLIGIYSYSGWKHSAQKMKNKVFWIFPLGFMTSALSIYSSVGLLVQLLAHWLSTFSKGGEK